MNITNKKLGINTDKINQSTNKSELLFWRERLQIINSDLNKDDKHSINYNKYNLLLISAIEERLITISLWFRIKSLWKNLLK